jgi:hypothetical protein
LFLSIFKSLNGGFGPPFLLRTMEREMLFLVRHSSAFGALSLEKLIEERRFICALCESLIQRMATSFLLAIVLQRLASNDHFPTKALLQMWYV